MISPSDNEISLLSSIETILKKKFYNISDEEIATMRTYWYKLINDEDIDAPYKLENLLAIIDNLERNEKTVDGKYHKSDFEHIMLYLKGQLTPEQLGLVDSETFFFSFAGVKFGNLASFTPNKEKLSTIGYFFSKRNNKRDNIAGHLINFLSNHSRISDNANPIITNSRLSEISSTYPFLSDFIDSHSICQISRSLQSVLLKILNEPLSARVLEQKINELKRDIPDSYYSEVLGKAIFKCVAHTVGSSKNIDQEVINILTTDIQFISSFTDTELNNISGLIRDNENFRNNIFEIMRSDEGFKDKVFSSLSTGIKKQYYQFIVENSTGFKIANIHAREKIKSCLLNIPQELIDLLSLTSTDVKNWQDADIEQKPSHELSKEIDLEAKDTDRNELKFFARLDENGNFIMGSMNPENGLLISGLKISSSGIMGIGRFNEEGNLVIDADSQENLFNHFKNSNPKSIEICTKFIEALKRFDLVDAEIGLPIGRDFFFLKELDGRWFLGKKVASSKDVDTSIKGLVLSGNGIKKFSETDNDYSSDYVPVYEDLTPPPPPPPKNKLSINPNNPNDQTSQSGSEDANNPDDRTSQSGNEDISVGCCGLFNRLTKRIGSLKIMPRSITLPRNWRALRNNLSHHRQR